MALLVQRDETTHNAPSGLSFTEISCTGFSTRPHRTNATASLPLYGTVQGCNKSAMELPGLFLGGF